MPLMKKLTNLLSVAGGVYGVVQLFSMIYNALPGEVSETTLQ